MADIVWKETSKGVFHSNRFDLNWKRHGNINASVVFAIVKPRDGQDGHNLFLQFQDENIPLAKGLSFSWAEFLAIQIVDIIKYSRLSKKKGVRNEQMD